MNTKPNALRVIFYICSVLVVSGALETAQAAPVVWGSGSDNVFTTPGNWVGGVLPTTADDAVFDGSVVGTPSTLEVNNDITVGGIQFLSNVTTPTVTIGNGSGSPVTLSLSSSTPNPLIAVSNTTGNVIVQQNVGVGSGSFAVNFVSGSFRPEGSSTITMDTVLTSSSAANLTKSGTGTLILNQPNTWVAGTLNLNNGTVRLGVNNTMPIGITLTNNSTTTAGTLDLNGFNQQMNGLGTNAAGGAVTIGNSSTVNDSALTISGSGTHNFSGIIKDTVGGGNRKVSLAKLSAVTQNLYGANTYSGGTTLNAGGIGLGVDSVYSGGAVVSGPLGTGDVTLNSTLTTFTALNVPRVIHNNFILNVAMTIAGTQPLTFTNGNYQLTAGRNFTINNTTTSTIFADNLMDIGTAVTWTKPGAGKLIMMVVQPSTFLGGITATAGTIAAGNGSPFPTNNNNQITFNAATLDLNGFDVTLSRLGGNASGSVLLGNNTLTAGNNLSSSEFSGVMSGTGGYVKVGTVSQTLSGTNTFTGGITIKEGPIYFSTNGLTPDAIALGPGPNIITISTNGTNNGSIGAARGTSIVTNSVVLVSPFALFDPANAGTLFILAGQVSGSGGFLRSDKGSGNGVILTGSNTFTGGVLMTSRSLMLGHKNALGTGTLTIGDPTIPPPSPRFIELASTVDLTGANAITNPITINQSFSLNTTNLGSPIDFGLELSGPVTLSGATNTIGSSGIGLVKLSGIIGGSGGINKGGPNTLTLSANNTYTGSTIVSNGSLALIGSGSVAASSNITILAGATLDASGRTDGGLTVGAAQTLKGDGAFNVLGNLTNNGTVELKAFKSGSVTTDTVQGATHITYGGTLNVVLSGDSLTTSDSLKLFDATSYSGSFANIVPGTPGTGLLWDTSTLATDGTLRTASNPAPFITTFSFSGTNLIMSGTSGTPGASFSVVSSTNIATLLASWPVVQTGTFGGSGEFSITNGIAPGDAQRFFSLRVP